MFGCDSRTPVMCFGNTFLQQAHAKNKLFFPVLEEIKETNHSGLFHMIYLHVSSTLLINIQDCLQRHLLASFFKT